MMRRDDLTELEQRVYDELAMLADIGANCPTCAVLAGRVGMASLTYAGDVMVRLERKGLIAITRKTRGRVVTIMATGKSTAGGKPDAGGIADVHLRALPPPQPRTKIRHLVHGNDPLPRGETLAARIDADQARLRAEREHWLAVEQQRYGLPKRGRLIEEMPA